ncbi:Asp23/Gls24 family envelope stress response protein [Streptomyces sp. NPDC058657]|uniref:Asp23/Gls24 family envelope stress response protein n=1 Tax=unclassified Streptomyces TaxID=2593676 RepID=UPI00365AFAF1
MAAAAGTAASGRATAPGAAPAAERGGLWIADGVVAKIAGRAAGEVLDAPPDGRPPHAEVAVRDGEARVRVAVELGYPSDVGAQCDRVRRQVASRVSELAGMEVPEVTVTVERLHRAAPAPGRTM